MPSPVWLVDSPYRTLQAGDRLWGHRTEAFRWELLDLSGSPLGTLDGVTGGSLEYSNATTLRASGSLSYEGAAEVDWLHCLVQPWYSATYPDGTNTEWPLGVFIPAAPTAQYGDGTVARDVELQSLLQVLDEDVMDKSYGLAAGTVVTSAVRSLITGAGMVGGGRVAGTDSTETLRAAMVWDAGTSRLRIINDLLDAVNYFSLWVDGMGTYRLDPYVAPSLRGSAWDFTDDPTASIYEPRFSHSRDYFGVPNRVVAIAQGSGDAPALTATASNTNAADPLSIPSRGRTITHVEDNVEATSLEALQGIATRRLAELSAVSSVVEISHAMVPLDPNDAVGFKRGPAGIDLRGVAQKLSIECAVGGGMRTTIREVVS